MAVEPKLFKQQFERFKSDICKASKGADFVSFHEGLPKDWESYKLPLRNVALKNLQLSTWTINTIGKGAILNNVIAAIEINENNVIRNNLVNWPNRYGHSNRSHHRLIDALYNKVTCRQFEQLLFNLFNSSADEDSFEQLRSLAGSRYDLIAYLFFLKDKTRFMPIAPTTFDKAFALLGIDLATSQHCSWDNYKAYNAALADVRVALSDICGLKNVALIDAHSFCWMLVRVPQELLADNSAASQKSSSGFSFNNRQKALWYMAYTAWATANKSNGQQTLTTVKNKNFDFNSQNDMMIYLDKLIDKQKNCCNLTGIDLNFDPQGDSNLNASLDRIDSNGHYSKDNLQVVCKFINKWKGSMENELFRRLLSLVRGQDDF